MADPKLAAAKSDWTFLAYAPPREVFAVMEQMMGVPPFRFEVVGPDEARIIETQRIHWLVGGWSNRIRRPRWVTVRAVANDQGTLVTVHCSTGSSALARAMQLVQLLTRGARDWRSQYRDRRIPLGPVTLVASWAGMAYRLFDRPDFEAPRSGSVYTATRMEAVETQGSFVRVRTVSGDEGWVERDQLVPSPVEATRAAGEQTARATEPTLRERLGT